LSHADSPTNLLWRLQNDQAPISRIAQRGDENDAATFTELTIDVRPDDKHADAPMLWGMQR
jgi:twitching motility protein PilU